MRGSCWPSWSRTPGRRPERPPPIVREREIAFRSRYHRNPTAVIVDIDHFKRVNDTHGHDFGDTVLRMVAETLRGQIRGADFIARYGGEEFCVILPYTEGDMALTICERLRSADGALYLAKAGGRNRVECFGGDAAAPG